MADANDFNQAAAALNTPQLSASEPVGGTLTILWNGAPLEVPATGEDDVMVQAGSDDAVLIISNLPAQFNGLPAAVKRPIIEQMFRAYLIGLEA
jgi:hypothetical protein